ncbi:hypothetical protein CES85_4501 [Ochrobactrum quorumnocens]|uniref:Uncharacterized protein n=1 Tax=Ochrobactrum quorumnocens TaxID=271865 RepID=A0A248UAI1_9HYPH|nr:hypothetical protein CES85_4501 [[Ochrobactrum] quorumnocens]
MNTTDNGDYYSHVLPGAGYLERHRRPHPHQRLPADTTNHPNVAYNPDGIRDTHDVRCASRHDESVSYSRAYHPNAAYSELVGSAIH